LTGACWICWARPATSSCLCCTPSPTGCWPIRAGSSHQQPAYAELGYGPGDFPISDQIHREVLSLPLWPGMSDAQVDVVIEAVAEAARLTQP
jgi:hypothetical protein